MAATSAEALNSHAAVGGPDTPGEQESSGSKKVVRVVRRVVRRVVPAGTEEQNQSTVSMAAADTKPRAAVEEKDDLSMGLTSLMGRSRTKEHRPRIRTQDRKEDTKEEVKQEGDSGKVEEQEEKPAPDKPEDAKPTATAAAPNPTPLKSNLLTPPAGFIPPPKPDPLAPPAGFIPPPKSDPLAPPAGFIPTPKQNPLTPPPGFIPAKKTSPVALKQNILTRPPGFIPVPKADPLAPPAGFIPKPHPLFVKKPEVLSRKSACLPFYCRACLPVIRQTSTT